MSEIAIFLRNGPHSSATERYALKAEDVSIQIAKTPVQIPVTRNDPELIDIGFYRPSITVSGIIDNIGGNPSNTTTGYQGMESTTLPTGDAIENITDISSGVDAQMPAPVVVQNQPPAPPQVQSDEPNIAVMPPRVRTADSVIQRYQDKRFRV